MSDKPCRLFWGDMHHNSYQYPEPNAQKPALDEVLREAADVLDFYAAAYYTPCMRHVAVTAAAAAAAPSFKGAGLEGWKPDARIDREWAEIQAVTRAANRPGAFAVFPGYEWQGDGTWGDHNVFAPEEGLPVFRAQTVSGLYAALRGRRAIAVPHHTGYRPRRRAPDWSQCDDHLTPFSEIYSVHGCSETDEDWVGLRHNIGMGPGTSGGTWSDALRRGLRLGCIGSTDNWNNVPGHYNHGLMACLAPELTREALWEAFLARRVYAVSGDRIALDFTVNGAPMGSAIPAAARRAVRVRVRGCDAIDRIELLRNERVIATRCHQGTWAPPAGRAAYKLRVEAGWGPKPGTLPRGTQAWEGELRVEGGRMIAAEPYRISNGHGRPRLAGDRAAFTMATRQEDLVGKPFQNAFVFEFEAAPDAAVSLRLNGLEERGSLSGFCAGSRVMWFRDDAVRLIRETTGLDIEAEPRQDMAYSLANKAKIHRAMPESAFTAELAVDDDEPVRGCAVYRVRVEQRNGQRAWSSPVWVGPVGPLEP